MNSEKKKRVLYIVKGYPQISQTYVKTELEAVWEDFDVTIVCRKEPDVAYRAHYPYVRAREPERVREIIEEVRPDVLHTHYLNQVDVVGELAQQTGVPFTVRAHSFDRSHYAPAASSRSRSTLSVSPVGRRSRRSAGSAAPSSS